MSREESNAWLGLFGKSQDYIDEINRARDDYRAKHADDSQPLWEGPETETESEDVDGAPLSPPASPKGDGPDLSFKAYRRRMWLDLSRGLPSEDCAFEVFRNGDHI